MGKSIIRVRTRDSLADILASGESHAWRVAKGRERDLTHVQVVGFDGKRMIEGTFDPERSRRRQDGRLIIAFRNGRLIDCDVTFPGRGVVLYP